MTKSLRPTGDGWIAHMGGACPIGPETPCFIATADGYISPIPCPAGTASSGVDDHHDWWTWDCSEGNCITAYRLAVA